MASTPMLDRLPSETLAPKPLHPRLGLALVLGLAALVFLVRFTAPADWSDGYHQERAIAYATDILFNGDWICQTGAYEDITSKPPLLTWLLALSSMATGGPSDFSLFLPSALCTTLLALLILWAGTKYFGFNAGLLGALMYLLSPLGAKEMVLVRIDVLFSLTVALTALCAFQSWNKRWSWTWFWLAAALATLAKGPLGLVLGVVGLLAVFWEKRSGHPARLQGSHLAGIALFLAICGGWFAAAYWKMGKGLIDVMVGRELLGHVVQEKGGGPFSQFYLPILYVCRCFVPWVVLSLVGFWRTIKHPALSDEERRFERFVLLWFAGGLFVFSAAAHQRPDLIFPLLPPAALFAGREMARLMGERSWKRVWPAIAVTVVLGLSGMIFKYHYVNLKKEEVRRNRGLRELAQNIQSLGGGEFPLTHIDTPVALQFYLRTKRPLVPVTEAAELLRSSSAAFVAVRDLQALQEQLGTNGPAIYEVASWQGRKDKLTIVSNHPKLEWTRQMICLLRPFQVELQDIDSVQIHGTAFQLSGNKPTSSVVVSALGKTPPPVIEAIGKSIAEGVKAKASETGVRVDVKGTVQFRIEYKEGEHLRIGRPPGPR